MADDVDVVAAVSGLVMAAAVAGLVAALVAGLEAAAGEVLAEGVWAKARPAAAKKTVSDFGIGLRMFMNGILARRI